MRVLHLAPHPDSGGGIADYASRFAKSVELAGGEVHLLSPPIPRRNSLSEIRAYRAAVGRALAKQRPDAVLAELGGVGLAEFWAVAHLLRRGGPEVPVAITVHDPPSPLWWPFHLRPVATYAGARASTRALMAPFARLVQEWVVARAHTVLALSDSGRDSIARRYPGTAVSTLPFPIHGSSPSPPPSEDELVLGFHGYWYRGKGIERLLESLAMLPAGGRPVRLRMSGATLPGASGPTSEEIDRARKRLPPWVVLDALGYLPRSDVTAALQACHAIVLPYERITGLRSLTSTSAAMWDALAAGVPVVATAVRAMPEAVKHETNGLLVHPGSQPDLVDALERLRRDTGLCARLREGAADSASALDLSQSGRVALALLSTADAGRSSS